MSCKHMYMYHNSTTLQTIKVLLFHPKHALRRINYVFQNRSIWTLTKSCLLYIWNVQCSLWSKIFETRNPPETSEHQSSRPAASRQRSQDPLPEGTNLA